MTRKKVDTLKQWHRFIAKHGKVPGERRETDKDTATHRNRKRTDKV